VARKPQNLPRWLQTHHRWPRCGTSATHFGVEVQQQSSGLLPSQSCYRAAMAATNSAGEDGLTIPAGAVIDGKRLQVF
jgi:hypothetical protein